MDAISSHIVEDKSILLLLPVFIDSFLNFIERIFNLIKVRIVRDVKGVIQPRISITFSESYAGETLTNFFNVRFDVR